MSDSQSPETFLKSLPKEWVSALIDTMARHFLARAVGFLYRGDGLDRALGEPLDFQDLLYLKLDLTLTVVKYAGDDASEIRDRFQLSSLRSGMYGAILGVMEDRARRNASRWETVPISG